MILKICNRCGKVIPTGTKCNCITPYKKDYNKFRRDKKIKEFRASKEWRAVRAEVIEDSDGYDLYLYYTTGELVKGSSVHHIHPLSSEEGWKRRTDKSNLINLSEQTHGVIEMKYKNENARERLIQELEDIVAKHKAGAFLDPRGVEKS